MKTNTYRDPPDVHSSYRKADINNRNKDALKCQTGFAAVTQTQVTVIF